MPTAKEQIKKDLLRIYIVTEKTKNALVKIEGC